MNTIAKPVARPVAEKTLRHPAELLESGLIPPDRLAAVEAVRRETGASGPLVFAGFSQGVAMAYRAAAAVPCAGLIALAGDVPPEVDAAALPPVLIGRGLRDEWYDEVKMAADQERLHGAGIAVEECVFDGGHEWGEAFRSAAGAFLAGIARVPAP